MQQFPPPRIYPYHNDPGAWKTIACSMLGVETTSEIIPEVYDRLSTTAAMVHKLGGHFNSRQAIAAVIASCLDPVSLKFTRESCENTGRDRT